MKRRADRSVTHSKSGMVKALVTGATGLIGNRIATQLVEVGHSVSVLARDTERAAKVLPAGVEVMCADI